MLVRTNKQIAIGDGDRGVYVFAEAIIRLPAMTDGKKRLVEVGRALNAKQKPTPKQRDYAGWTWRVFRPLLGDDYALEVARVWQLYEVGEMEYRDEIARAIARRWDAGRWKRR